MNHGGELLNGGCNGYNRLSGSTGALLEYLEREGLPRPSMADVLSA